MSEPPRSTRNRSVWWLVGFLLLIPIVLPLLVTTYAREEPSIGGFPFFFWYQFLWIPLAAGITFTCYLLVSRQERRDREAGDRR